LPRTPPPRAARPRPAPRRRRAGAPPLPARARPWSVLRFEPLRGLGEERRLPLRPRLAEPGDRREREEDRPVADDQQQAAEVPRRPHAEPLPRREEPPPARVLQGVRD